MSRAEFSVRIVWHSDVHSPEWEFQTEHHGFDDWMAPALFANGFIEPHPWLIKLTAGRAVLALTDGSSLLVGKGRTVDDGTANPRSSQHRARGRNAPGLGRIQLSAWRMDDEAAREVREDDPEILTCGAYQELTNASATNLSRRGLDGLWWPQSYQVLGPDGHVPVTIEVNEAGDTLTLIRGDEDPAGDELDTAAIAFIMKV